MRGIQNSLVSVEVNRESTCQAIGASYDSKRLGGRRRAGAIGTVAAFSFFPSKNLGGFGDGGMMTTGDEVLAAKLRMLRVHGERERYKHQEIGINSRLDEMQAAILRARLPRLPGWTAHRRALAARYRERLAGGPVALLPEVDRGHVYHLFVVRTAQRQDAQRHLSERGVETLVHYPMAIPHQPAMRALAPDECPVATRACNEVLSLPLHQRLREAEVDQVAAAVKEIPCVL